MGKAKKLVADKRLYNRVLKAAKLIDEVCPRIEFVFGGGRNAGPELVALASDPDAILYWYQHEALLEPEYRKPRPADFPD